MGTPHVGHEIVMTGIPLLSDLGHDVGTHVFQVWQFALIDLAQNIASLHQARRLRSRVRNHVIARIAGQ